MEYQEIYRKKYGTGAFSDFIAKRHEAAYQDAKAKGQLPRLGR